MLIALLKIPFCFIRDMTLLIILGVLALIAHFKKKEKLIFGTTPIISYAYWCRAMKVHHPHAMTLMKGYYAINKKDDFDVYAEDVTPKLFRNSSFCKNFFAFNYIIFNAEMFVTSFDNVVLEGYFQFFEPFFLKVANVKQVILPYGGDSYVYRRVKDLSLQHGLLVSYPNPARNEEIISQNVTYRNKYADAIIIGIMNDGFGRWDVLNPQYTVIDTSLWKMKTSYSQANGHEGEVVIAHTPNHRGFKGSEFILQAVEELKDEGLKIRLDLIEKKKNSEVKEILCNADILAEQIIATGYALSGIEGMVTGLPVLSNLDSKAFTQIFRRYTFLNECPILSTTPENIKENLRLLITNPELREQLGRAGRKYTEKYHSYKTAQYMFGAIYDKIIDGKDVDLMNLFHPLLSEYNKSTPKVEHPLINNKFPQDYVSESKN